MLSYLRRFLLSFVALCSVVVSTGMAKAQALTVTPVNIQLEAGQKATSLTVVNQGSNPTSIQLRVYAWDQLGGTDQLTSSNAVLVSPPLATIEPGATQIVRIVLRRSPEGHEETYRIVLDQIPPPAEPGIVHVVLRMSIPIFAETKARGSSHMQFHVEREAGKTFLIALNNGARHDTLRNIELWTKNNLKLQPEITGSPYVLAGVTRRWQISAETPDTLALPSDSFRLKALASTGAIEEQVHFVGAP